MSAPPPPPPPPPPSGAGEAGPPAEDQSPARGRRRLGVLAAAGAVVAVAAVAVVVVTGGGDGPSGCLSGLAPRVPPDGGVLHGSDLERARARGMDDSDGLEGAMDWLLETGVGLDPLTRQAWSVQAGGDTSSATGYEPSAVRCWVGGGTSVAVRGSFDAGRVGASDLGSSDAIDVDGDLLVRRGTATDRPAGARGLSSRAAGVLEALDDRGAVAFTALSADDDAGETWTAVALTSDGDGDDWDLLVVWTFADRSAADSGEDEIRETLAGRSAVADLVEGDPAGRLERDGTTLWLRAPLATDTPSDWHRLQTNFDPIFLVGGG